ncbi:MAG: FAD-binding oxidoreductase [Acidiferrobacteraceae bacterium]|jgi:glycolate oxidase|nr:FAD-binding oxidoreductase [Acidiferrobacteraceae bacterium]MCP4830135.1 FAD-binding protein [Pseudomonadota bacterium]|tara:strand:- start:7746 stop:9209 length:1464 start_codon:yes stop_codon:yes gene_type:complete
MSQESLDQLVKELASVLPPEALLRSSEACRPYECDGLTGYRALPAVVALPDSFAQVQSILKLCERYRVPLVARGAGTGLSGGATPHPEGVLLSMARFNRIIAIDPAARTARVQPGVRNLAISEAVAEDGLYFAPDPSSQIACTIGGNVAENAGGVHCLKYGLTVHNVIAAQVVLMGGEVLTVGGTAPDAPGYDLLATIIGSEGMLGVVTEVTVRLLPLPESARVLLAAFNTVDEAAKAVAQVIGQGIIPAGLEMMDNPAIVAAEDFVQAGYPTDAAAILLCEIDGTIAEVESEIATVSSLLRDNGAFDVKLARDEAERLRFWSGRKNAFPAVGRISPDYYCIDGTIPRKAIGEVLSGIAALAAKSGLRVANVFHAGDGNLHPLILYDAGQPGEFERTEALGGEILELCVRAGGTITGEHGVGLEKIDHMCVQFTQAELAQFHALKAVFDPHGLLNPGKAVPTLARCAEFNAMHVHQGQLPHPDIPRF